MGLSPSEKGLACLINTRPSTSAPAHITQILHYVLGAAAPADASDSDVDYEQLCRAAQEHVAQLRSQHDQPSASSSSGGAAEQPGRLGPRTVAVDRSSVCGSFCYSSDGLTLESLGNFTSCRANVAVYAGRWQYECTVLTPGIQQIGWATVHCPFTAEEGVGDAQDSYAVDGKRVRKWNVKPQPYGESWVPGDVMGCLLDLDGDYGSITFYRNGTSLGVAYNKVRVMQPSLAYFPAVSLSHTERCTLNFGLRPFMYPVEGFQPLQAAPSAADRAAAEYYCGCLMRLCLLAADVTDCGGGGQPGGMVGGSGKAAAAECCGLPEGLPAAAGGSSGAGSAPPTPSAVAAVAAAAAAVGSGGGWVPPLPFSGPVSLGGSDVVLLGALLLQPLQELLLQQPYLVRSVLLPVLADLQRLGGEQQRQLHLLLQLLAIVWDPDSQAFKYTMAAVLGELAFRCQMSPLLAQDFPCTASYPHLSLAVALLQHPAVMTCLVRHDDFSGLVEGLMARKAPSPKDLQQLLPHVWWPGCKDETASEERLRACVSIITATMAKVEQRQYELLELLLACPWPSSTTSSNEEDCALLVFLRFLLQKNRSALRDVPPPGLSEPTVLMSAFFVLLRMLQPALLAASSCGAGPLAAFPAAGLFAESGRSAESSAVFDMPRLGGIVSHLAREHPLSERELQPVSIHAAAAAADSSSGAGLGASTGATTLQQLDRPEGAAAAAAGPAGVAEPAAGTAGRGVLKDAWLPELLNCCLLMYCWRVGFNYKMIHSLSSSVASSSSTLEELDRMIANYNEAGESVQATTWVAGTRKVYHDELVRDVRLLTLLRVAFFSPGKQAALCNLASYLAALLTNISSIPPAAAPAPEVSAAAGDSSDDGDSHALVQRSHAAAAAAAAPREGDSAAADDGVRRSNLLCYVPVVYVDVIVDFLTALRRCDQPVGAALSLPPQAGSSFLAWLCSALNDPRIANPDVQENLLQVVAVMLDHPEWRNMVEAAPQHTRQLLEGLLVVFDSRLWHPASGVLIKVIRDCGFGHPDPRPWPPSSLQQILLDCLDPAGPEPSPAAAAARTRGFLNRLFSTMNWCLTEFTVSVGELHSLRGRRSILEAQNQYRRTGLMFELSVSFMRILEFVVPTRAFLSSAVNRTRLRELLQFVLLHFTNGPDARRLNELLQSSQPGSGSSSGAGASGSADGASSSIPAAAAAAPGTPDAAEAAAAAASAGAIGSAAAGVDAAAGAGGAPGAAGAAAGVGSSSSREQAAARSALPSSIPAYAASAMRFESNSLAERVQKPPLLAPVMGILLALWDAACEEESHAAPATVAGEAVAGDGVLQELAAMADQRFMSALLFLQDVDWCAAFPSLPLSGRLRAFRQLLDSLASARSQLEIAAAAAGPADEVPDDFLDPITMELMRQPVRLPDSQITVDRSTIERHLLSSASDPFSRAPLTVDLLLPDEGLQQRIQAWIKQQQQQQQQHRQQL